MPSREDRLNEIRSLFTGAPQSAAPATRTLSGIRDLFLGDAGGAPGSAPSPVPSTPARTHFPGQSPAARLAQAIAAQKVAEAPEGLTHQQILAKEQGRLPAQERPLTPPAPEPPKGIFAQIGDNLSEAWQNIKNPYLGKPEDPAKRADWYRQNPRYLAKDIAGGTVDSSELAQFGAEELPWEELAQVPMPTESPLYQAIAKGRVDSEGGLADLLAVMHQREGNKVYSGGIQFAQGAVSGASMGAAPKQIAPKSGVEQGLGFAGEVVGQMLPISLAAPAAAAAVPASLATKAPMMAKAVESGLTLGLAKAPGQAVRLAKDDDYTLTDAAKETGATVLTGAAFGAIGHKLDPALDRLGASLGKITPGMQSFATVMPRTAEFLGNTGKAVTGGFIKGAAVNVPEATVQEFKSGNPNVLRWLRNTVTAGGQEVSEEIVEALAFGLTSRLAGRPVRMPVGTSLQTHTETEAAPNPDGTTPVPSPKEGASNDAEYQAAVEELAARLRQEVDGLEPVFPAGTPWDQNAFQEAIGLEGPELTRAVDAHLIAGNLVQDSEGRYFWGEAPVKAKTPAKSGVGEPGTPWNQAEFSRTTGLTGQALSDAVQKHVEDGNLVQDQAGRWFWDQAPEPSATRADTSLQTAAEIASGRAGTVAQESGGLPTALDIAEKKATTQQPEAPVDVTQRLAQVAQEARTSSPHAEPLQVDSGRPVASPQAEEGRIIAKMRSFVDSLQPDQAIRFPELQTATGLNMKEAREALLSLQKEGAVSTKGNQWVKTQGAAAPVAETDPVQQAGQPFADTTAASTSQAAEADPLAKASAYVAGLKPGQKVDLRTVAKEAGIQPGQAGLMVKRLRDEGLMTYEGNAHVRTDLPAPATTPAHQALLEVMREEDSQVRKAEAAQRAGLGILPPGMKLDPPKLDYQPAVEFDPETERRWREAKGLPPQPKAGILDGLKRLGALASREFEHLTRAPQHERFRQELHKLNKGKGVASDQAVLYMQGLTRHLNKVEADLFTRGVILADLVEEASLQQKRLAENPPENPEDAEIRLPFGYTPEKVKADYQKVQEAMAQHPKVAEAIEKRKEVLQSIVGEYKALAKDVTGTEPPLDRKEYYRHQVLAMQGLKRVAGTGEELHAPTRRGFLKRRQGSELDINTNYLEAEHEFLAQLLYDTQIYKTLKLAKEVYDISPGLQMQAKAQRASVKDLIPEGYVEWAPSGKTSAFYKAWSIPEQYAEAIANKQLTEAGVPAKVVKEILAVGPERNTWVVPEEVAKTLNSFDAKTEDTLTRWVRKAIGGWKSWQVASPKRAVKFQVRNMSGDLDAAFHNPDGLRKVPQALTDLYQHLIKKDAPSAELQAWMERGGMQDLLNVAEDVSNINGLKMFYNFGQQKGVFDRMKEGEVGAPAKEAWGWYWRNVRKAGDFREAILRYANYLSYGEQMAKGGGRPKNWGASDPKLVEALPDVKDRAYKLSNELMGAYDQVSVMGQWLKNTAWPFWSWNEVNFRRNVGLLRNAIRSPETAQQVGKFAASKLAGVVVKSPLIALQVGKYVLAASAFTAMTTAWNHLLFPDEERELPASVKTRPYIILGRDDQGNVVYFNRLGAGHDFLEWFGLADAPQQWSDYANGKKTLGQIVGEMVKSPVSKVFGGIGPYGTAVELVSGRSFYPDPFRPRTIRDRWEHLADSVGLGDEHRELTGKPTRGYASTLQNVFSYRIDPKESAYNEVRGLKADFLARTRGETDVSSTSPKSNALYYYKQAIRYGDQEAAEKYLAEYFLYGGTQKGLKQSLEALDPLWGLSKENRKAFLESLSAEDREKVGKAVQFYNENLK